MEVVNRSESFHDWYLLGVAADLDAGEVELRLMFDNKKDHARVIFKGASRCLVHNFLIQNIIYSIEVLKDFEADEYKRALHALDDSYSWGRNKPKKNIAAITATLGAELFIEFDSLVVESITR